MANVNVRDIPEELHRELKAICARRGITINNMMIELIRQLVERSGK